MGLSSRFVPAQIEPKCVSDPGKGAAINPCPTPQLLNIFRNYPSLSRLTSTRKSSQLAQPHRTLCITLLDERKGPFLVPGAVVPEMYRPLLSSAGSRLGDLGGGGCEKGA